MNRLQKPCVEDTEYNFALCVEKSIIPKSGCLPFWNKFIYDDQDKAGVPICENSSMLHRYGIITRNFQNMPRDDLVKTTGCLMPCSYVEYTVSLCILFSYLIHLIDRFEWFECISELSESIASRKGKCFICSIGSCPGSNNNCADRAGGLPFSLIRG